MKLRIEAEPEELASRGNALVEALAKAVAPHNPALAEKLAEVASAPPATEGRAERFQAMEPVVERVHQLYQHHADRMLSELAAALETAVLESVRAPQEEPAPDNVVPFQKVTA